MSQRLRSLKVIGLRYRRSVLAPNDERCLNAYREIGVYSAAGVPFSEVEPRFHEKMRQPEEHLNIGILGGMIAEEVASGLKAGDGILVTGGDCTHSTGVLGGLQLVHGADARIGLVWFDAHGDFNTPKTTLTGSLGGMPVAARSRIGVSQVESALKVKCSDSYRSYLNGGRAKPRPR